MQKNILVKEKNENDRLDKFLHEFFPEYSRSYLQKIIKKGEVKIDGQISSVHHFLKTGEKIEINLSPPAKLKIKPDSENKLDIIFENDDFLIINKPAGLLVHPAEGQEDPTLVGQLINHLPDIKKVGEDSLRPGIVHRLDKKVSGLMVIAKNQKTFDNLKQQFKNHKIKKEYLALVKGKLKKLEGIINFPIGRSKEGGFVARPKEGEGKTALTKYELIKNKKNYSLLKIRTITGRTHQIRLHLKAIGYPVVGDKLYKNKKEKEKIQLDRLFLHSALLGFFDKEKKWHEFTSNLPSNLEEILKSLES